MRTSDAYVAVTVNQEVIERCQEKIMEKLDLKSLPDIGIAVRHYQGPDRRGRYRLPKHGVRVDEPAENFRDSGWFDDVIHQFKENYCLPYNTRKDIPYEVYLIEPLIHLGGSVISGGLNWVIEGTLNSGEKYAAIKDVEVRPMLRGCGLMALMTECLIELAKARGRDFIHTWHSKDNPFFLCAAIPELRSGFLLYRGSGKDGELYEDEGYVHLRYYMDRQEIRNVMVRFADGKKYQSPKDNAKIVNHLIMLAANDPRMLPGKKIISIEEYRGSGQIMAALGKPELD